MTIQDNPAGEENESMPPLRIHETANYITAIIGGSQEEAAHEPVKGFSRFMEMLPTALKNPALKEELIDVLKESADAGEFLVKAVSSPEGGAFAKDLLAMCWEAGLNMSAHLAYFSQLAATSNDPFILLEVQTIIQDMDLSDAPARKTALEVLVRSIHGKTDELAREIVSDIIQFLESRD